MNNYIEDVTERSKNLLSSLSCRIMMYHVFDGTTIGYDNLVDDISRERSNNKISEYEYNNLMSYLNEY